MPKVLVNVPIIVDATIKPVSQSDAAAFGIYHEDVVQLTGITMPARLTLSADHIVIVEDTIA